MTEPIRPDVLVLAPTRVCAEVRMREENYDPRQWRLIMNYGDFLTSIRGGYAKVICIGDWWHPFRGHESDDIYDALTHEANAGRIKLEYLSA